MLNNTFIKKGASLYSPVNPSTQDGNTNMPTIDSTTTIQVPKLYSESAQDLLQEPVEELVWYVDNFISQGLTILAGDPKVGKSWFVLQMALSISSGQPFLNRNTKQANCAYFALEANYEEIIRRLQSATATVDETTGASLDIIANNEKNQILGLESGLMEQLEAYIKQHKDTKVIILDTFAAIRDSSNSNMFQGDYNDLKPLKQFCDIHKLAIVLVHHTRKMNDDNAIKTISGSQGLTAATDTNMVLKKDSRNPQCCNLILESRNTIEQSFVLSFTPLKRWVLVEENNKFSPNNPIVPDEIYKVIDYIKVVKSFEGTISELNTNLGLRINPSQLGTYLAKFNATLKLNNIAFTKTRTSQKRLIELSLLSKEE